MFGAGVLASVLLAAPATAQTNQLVTAWSATAHAGVFDYTPEGFPVNPSDGWNFSTSAQNGLFPYQPPLYDNNAMAYTTHVGAKVTTRFYGYGAVVRGLVPKDVEGTVTLTLDGDGRLSNTTVQQGRYEGKLVEVLAKEKVNKWRTMTLTLDKGAVQFRNVSFMQAVTMGYQYAQDSPYRGVNATQFDANTVDRYYSTTGSWKTERVLEPGYLELESPHIIGDPGTTVAFKTWPGASTLILRGIHGREAGAIKYKVEPSPHDGFPDEVAVNLARPIEGVNSFAEVVLDPAVRYNVTITNSDPQRKFKFSGAFSSLSSDTYKNWSPADDLPKTESKDNHDDGGTNVGAIVGGVVGGVAGAALLAGLLLCLWRNRHRRNPLEDDDKFVIDDTAMASALHVTPMPLPVGAVNKPVHSSTALTPEDQQLLSDRPPSQHRTSFTLSSSGQTYVPHLPFHPPQEDDAGPISSMDTVPPSYNPAWAGSDPDGAAPSNTYSRSSFMSSTPTQAPLHLHGGYDQKNLRAMDDPAEEEPRPEAPPLPTKTKPPGS